MRRALERCAGWRDRRGDAALCPGFQVERRRLGLEFADLQILDALANGSSNDEIGKLVHLSAHTVKDRATKLCQRLGARRRVDLVTRAFRAGLIV